MAAVAGCWLCLLLGPVPPKPGCAIPCPVPAWRGASSESQHCKCAQLQAQPRAHVGSAGREGESPAKERCQEWKQTEMTQPGHEETSTVGVEGKNGLSCKIKQYLSVLTAPDSMTAPCKHRDAVWPQTAPSTRQQSGRGLRTSED